MNLMKELPRIAARLLCNTKTVHPDMKFKFQLIAEAYGEASIREDFEKWCTEILEGEIPKYPVSEYLKVVDSRLGLHAEEPRVDSKDPRVAELLSMTYELTSVLPSASSVAELVAIYSVDEIKGALTEFAENLTEREQKSAIHAFYANGGGGASAIILARRRRAGK